MTSNETEIKSKFGRKSSKTIIISATELQIDAIKKLSNIKIESLGDQVYRVVITSINISMPTVAEDISVNQLTDDIKDEATVELLDFDGSDDFYKCAAKKSGYKIISDEFSDIRNRELYKAFQLIEHKWRHSVSLWHLSRGKKLITNNGKIPDHAVATYVLADFYEQFLYAPATEEYMREMWEVSKKDSDAVISVANLKLLDELGIGLTVDELELIRETRNACMHSRVITTSEYITVMRLINRYLISEEQKEFTENIVATINVMQKKILDSVLRATESTRLMQDSLTKIAGLTVVLPKINIPQVFNDKMKEALQVGLKNARYENEDN